MNKLPKIGEILAAHGRKAVVIGIAGTVNRGTMPKRSCDTVTHHNTGTVIGVHIQWMDTGELATFDRTMAAQLATGSGWQA